jgi:hypothetical protein
LEAATLATIVAVGCSIARGVAVAAAALVGAATGASVAAGAAQAVTTTPPTVIADRRKKLRRLIFSERDICEIPPGNGLEKTNNDHTTKKFLVTTSFIDQTPIRCLKQ